MLLLLLLLLLVLHQEKQIIIIVCRRDSTTSSVVGDDRTEVWWAILLGSRRVLLLNKSQLIKLVIGGRTLCHSTSWCVICSTIGLLLLLLLTIGPIRLGEHGLELLHGICAGDLIVKEEVLFIPAYSLLQRKIFLQLVVKLLRHLLQLLDELALLLE